MKIFQVDAAASRLHYSRCWMETLDWLLPSFTVALMMQIILEKNLTNNNTSNKVIPHRSLLLPKITMPHYITNKNNCRNKPQTLTDVPAWASRGKFEKLKLSVKMLLGYHTVHTAANPFQTMPLFSAHFYPHERRRSTTCSITEWLTPALCNWCSALIH